MRLNFKRMAQNITNLFNLRKKQSLPVFVGFCMDSYPTASHTVSYLLSLQKGGADIIELAVPHTDPIADGPTVQKGGADIIELAVPHTDPIADGPTAQKVSKIAVENKSSISTALSSLSLAREKGLVCPVVIFGYYNTFRAYGHSRFALDARKAGADALLCVDLPPEASVSLSLSLSQENLGLIPLVTPTTTPERLHYLSSLSPPFVYCVALLGVTGARSVLSDELPNYMESVKREMEREREKKAGEEKREREERSPVVIGFGISNRDMFGKVAAMGEGVVVASAMLEEVHRCHFEQKGGLEEIEKTVIDFGRKLTGREEELSFPERIPLSSSSSSSPPLGEDGEVPKGPGSFGPFGGSFAPEILRYALDELIVAFEEARNDPKFWEEIKSYYTYIGRPTPLHEATQLNNSRKKGGKIWLKREDLAHTGAHKINNAIGQALLAKRIGKNRIIAETGAGQHGVACATVCAKLGMECTIYMGAEDVQRQSLNVFRMKMLGAKVVPVESGTRTLKDAVNEAMRAWVTCVRDSHYLIGSAIGPHPFPLMVREFQSCIGKETKEQFHQICGKLPDCVLACVGGGSNAIGMFHPFVEEKGVRIVGVEAAGAGLETDEHCAPLSRGTPGVLHGTRTLLMQTDEGQITPTHSISAGLDYPGVGPEHAWLKTSGRAEYIAASDEEAIRSFELLSRTEGIIPALESAHAIHGALQIADQMKEGENMVVCLSGRGDKDMLTVAKYKGINLM